MKYIIEQQAQFAADVQLLKEQQAGTQRMTGQSIDVTMSLAHHADDTNQRLRQLEEETDRRLRELAEAVARTDRRSQSTSTNSLECRHAATASSLP